jgi:hypothetical protein
MSSGESGESLASRLADAEAALLFARVNEKRLSEENNRYRERCEELSTQLLEAATPAAPVATAKPPRVPDASAQADHEDRVLNLFLTDGKTLSERTVPGLVGAPNGALAFGTVSATVSGAEFVGLRPLRARRDEASSKPPTQPQRSMSDRISDMLSRGNDDENADGVGNADFDEEGADALPRRARRRSGSVASDASGDASSFRDSDGEESATEETERDANGLDGLLQSKRNAPREESLKTYEIVWKEGGGAGPLRRLAFEANRSGLAYVKKRVQAWSLEARQGGDAHDRARRATPRRHRTRSERKCAARLSLRVWTTGRTAGRRSFRRRKRSLRRCLSGRTPRACRSPARFSPRTSRAGSRARFPRACVCGTGRWRTRRSATGSACAACTARRRARRAPKTDPPRRVCCSSGTAAGTRSGRF